jgi:glycerol kinase
MFILAIDEGTTGVRAMIFDENSALIAGSYREITSHYPRPGWMEQDPLHIWRQTETVYSEALEQAGLRAHELTAIGVANQRATTLVWEKATGHPVYPAIGWQDGRTAERVATVLEQGLITFSVASATKIEWILTNIDRGFERAAAGELCFGTVDSWIIWNLSGRAAHVTDHSNASATSLCDPLEGGWKPDLLAILKLPESMFPNVVDSSGPAGETAVAVFGASIPIAGIAGDQQAAMFAELATEPGAVKITYGTSGMIDINTGAELVLSGHGAYPLVLWSLEGKRTWCLEGTVITAGAAVQWLHDGAGVIDDIARMSDLAASVPDSGGVWVVPAFQGLGTPYMEPEGRAVIGGLTRGTTRAHIARATLEGIASRSREALQVLLADAGYEAPPRLRVDGGAAANDFLLQSVANVVGIPVERPETVQATALGAAYLAGMATGVWYGIEDVRGSWRSGGVFEPQTTEDERETRFKNWQKVVYAARLGGID